jgi:hypothetical protein
MIHLALPHRTQASWDQRFVHRSAGADLKLGPGYGRSRTADTYSAIGPGSVPITHQVSGSCPGRRRGATLPLTYHYSCRFLPLASPKAKESQRFPSTLVRLSN